MNGRCGTCKYFSPALPDDIRGECRRYPPVIATPVQNGADNEDAVNEATCFPVTIHDWWCGEYSQKGVYE